VAPGLWHGLAGEATFSPRLLLTAVNRLGVPFIWPIRLPGPDGKIDDWNASALEAAKRAEANWVRVTANVPLGAYEVWEATSDLPGPVWPEQSFGEMLKIAFKGRQIASPDHPALKKLRGEV
jgi:hypothetical protein